MPERPKRRKNNKNKRKNKNNRPDANKNISDETKLDNSESCNTQHDNEEDHAESEVTETKEIKVEILQPSTDNENTASNTSSNVVNLNGDLNNNSNQIVDDFMTIPAEKCHDTVPDTVDTQAYVVEAPEQSHQSKAKLKNKVKSKSLDDDDATKITEITEDDVVEPGNENALALIDGQNCVVTHVESDVEWESAADLGKIDATKPQEVATGTLSVTTIPLNVAQCDQTKSLTPDEEKSLRTYLNTLNLATQPEGVNSIEMKTEIEEIINQEIKHRLRKKASADDFFLQRLGPPRMLDVIDEEGSGSGSSMTSRRQSYLSDKRSDVEDLDDDVFEDNKNKLTKQKKMMSIAVHKKSYSQLVPQECVLVGAKIKEPDVSEARGDWTMKTVEKMTGAEIVYLTDTSSSTSSLHEIEDEDDGVDTDVSVRMITPTIEVTDTENFLKKTFISNAEDNKQIALIENQVTAKQNQFNKNAENETVSEKINDELKSQNVNEHIIKVESKDDQRKNIEKPMAIAPGTKTIMEVIQNTQIKDKSQTLVCNKASNNEHIVNIIGDQGVQENLPPSGKIKDAKKEHFINIEYEKITEDNKSDSEKVSSQNSHEIVVLSTDNIKTNLYVKNIDETVTKDEKAQTKQNKFDLESKVIKCEFNDAINNLIKEVTSESEESNENLKETFSRQDSSSSVDSSQCTAKYNPNYESLNDISNMTHDETSVNTKINSEQTSSTSSHVKDVFECVAGTRTQSEANTDGDTKEPLKLRDLCVRNIATLPYGKKILEELASVSERLQNIALYGTSSKTVESKQGNIESMPHYQLPDVSSIETITIPTKAKDPIPPPIKPRRSSLRKSSQEDEHWTGIPTKSEPVYVCLSPSQKMLMEKTNTVITKDDASHLVDMHRKYVDRRGYNEQYKNEKEREENEVDTTPIIPFKSQTGSRLLALIRDPTLTNTINSLNQRINISSEEIQKKRTMSSTFAKSNHDRFPSRDFSFKPIPPPRPKKYSSSFYESDESSDFTDSSMRSMKSERKLFHYSTGNLNKEIESDISTIQNMHRYFTDTRDEINDHKSPRRPSLPKDLCEQQMEYIRRKEKEVEAEIQRLEALKSTIPQMQRQGPRAPLVSEKEVISERIRDANNYSISRKKDVIMSSQGSEARKAKLSAFSSSQEELLREKMYSEYVSQMAEREERKQHKVIKITNTPATTNHITISKSMPTLDLLDGKVNNRIEKEFISKARERWDKLGIKDPETEDERETSKNVYKEPKVIEHKIKVIEGGEEKDVKKLPSHLQEFVRFTAKDSEQSRSSSGESTSGPASPHLVIMCAVIIIVIAVGKYFLRLLRNK